MDLLLFRRAEYDRLYNCTDFDVDLISMEQRVHVFHGILLIVLFIFFELLYIPCMLSMYRHLANPCYKFLFYIGVTDMLVMIMNGLMTGWLGLEGAVFCTHPTAIYTAGSVGLSLWFAETFAEFLLAINRCLELLAPRVAHQIYHGNRTWWLCCVPTVYAIILSLYTEPILFSGLYFSWFFNPYVGYIDDFGTIYHSMAHTVHDCAVIFCLSALYILFSVMLYMRNASYDANRQPTLAQKMTFLQVVIISFFNAVAAGIYIYMQMVRISEGLIIIGTYAWLFAHGIPPVIYLALNKTIRTDCLAMAKMLIRSKISPTTLFTHTGNRQQQQGTSAVAAAATGAAGANSGQPPEGPIGRPRTGAGPGMCPVSR